jgi:anaerobic magnesium-protoporphyrin IX monomethyl ester cyclase
METNNKKIKNFLLVIPPFVKSGEYYNFPVGIGYISSYLKKLGFNVFCLNLNHISENIPLESLLREHIENNKIDVFCTGTMSWYWNEVEIMLNLARKIKPDIINIVGGAIITADPKLAMDNLDIDIGLIGEGEITMAELAEVICQDGKKENVNGIVFSKNGQLVFTSPRAVIENLDELPFPDYQGLEFDKWNTLILNTGYLEAVKEHKNIRYAEILGSRSCPFRCTFCYHPLGNKYRQRSLDNIFAEIDYLVENYKVNYFVFLDELFSANHQRMLEFANRIKKYEIVGWGASFRVNDVSLEVLKTLKDSGLKYMGFGIENINDNILKKMEKYITKSEIENALNITKEAGIQYAGNIIFGDPNETVETIENSIKWLSTHPFYNISIVPLKVIPDSPIFQLAVKRGLIKDKLMHSKNRFPLINMTTLSDRKFFKYLSRLTWIDQSKKFIQSGRLIKLEQKKSDDGQKVFCIDAECPFCHTVSHYDRSLNNEKKDTYICYKCMSTFVIFNRYIFLNDYKRLTTNLAYFKKFILAYLPRFKFYRERQTEIISFLIIAKRKIYSLIKFLKI